MWRFVLHLFLASLIACSSTEDDPADAGSTARDATAGADASPNADAEVNADASENSDAETNVDAETNADATTPADSGVPDECEEPAGAIRVVTTITAALDQAQPGDTVVVPAGTYNERVIFPRSGEIGSPITLMAGCDGNVLIDGTGLSNDVGRPALITIADRTDLVVRGFELANLTGEGGNFPSGIWIRGTNKRIRIIGNRVHDIRAENGGMDSGAHGIAVYGETPEQSEEIFIEKNEVYNLSLGWSEAVVFNGNIDNFVVSENIVHDVDNIAFDFIGFEDDVCTLCSQEDRFDNNVNRVRNGLISKNLAYNMTTANNPAYGGEKAAACFYVDGGAFIVFDGNTAHDCDLGIEIASEHFGKSSTRVIARNNFIYDNDVTGIALGGYDPGMGAGGGSAVGCAIVNNTIVNSSRDGWADTGLLLQNRNLDNVYMNNIIIASAGSSAVSDVGTMNMNNTFDYNIYFGGSVENIAEPGVHSLTTDPMLVAPATGDLHLSQGSVAINAGTFVLESGEFDIDGDSRTNGITDIGADER